MEKTPENLNEVSGGALAGVQRYATRQVARAGKMFGNDQSVGSLDVQDAAVKLAREFFQHVGSVKAGGAKVTMNYANMMTFLRQRHRYVPDELAQSQIMDFMKRIGAGEMKARRREAKKAQKKQNKPDQQQTAAPTDPNDPSYFGPLKETFEVIAARLLEAEDDFEFMAAALLLEDVDTEEDELYQQAEKFVIQNQKVSVAYLQNKLGVSYAAAQQLIEDLEENGVVSSADAMGRRSVLKRAPEQASEWDYEPTPEDQQAADAQAQQHAEAPGPNGEQAPEDGVGGSGSKARKASASRWVKTIEPKLPGLNAPLSRSQMDKLWMIVGSDMVRRKMMHFPSIQGDNRGGGTPGGGGSPFDDNTTESGAGIDMRKFNAALADAGISTEQIKRMYDDAKSAGSVDAAKRGIDQPWEKNVAAGVVAAFLRSLKKPGW